MSKNETKKISENALIERYKQSWNEIRLIHDFQWKSLTIVTPIISALMGLTAIRRELAAILVPFAIVIILFGLFVVIKDRKTFLTHMMIIARTEKLLGMHEDHPRFADEPFLPKEFSNISRQTYEDYIEDKYWRKGSLFLLFVGLYVVLLIFVIILSFLVIRIVN